MDYVWPVLLPSIQLIGCLIVLWKICDTMVEGIASLAHYLKIPQSVAGATLAAASSSVPEFGTSVFAILITEGGDYADIGPAVVIGSAIFNVLVIIGVSALFQDLKVARRSYYRDGAFYLITVVLVILALRDGYIQLREAAVALALYGLYGAILLYDTRMHQERHAAGSRSSEAKDIASGEILPAWLACSYFFGGMAIVAVACHFLVDAVVQLSRSTGVPEVVLSVLAVAAGTSIPDCFASIAAARRGNGAMAISNALVSNVFDILVCLGFPLCILGAKGGRYEMGVRGGALDPLGKCVLVVSLLYLLATSIVTLFVLRHKWNVGKGKGLMLIALYLGYCALIVVLYIARSASWITEVPRYLGFG